MKISIRKEEPVDYNTVHNVIKDAFSEVEISDHKEHLLVERLRKSNHFIPELSLIALNENQVIGHILLTKIKVINDEKAFDSLALAPVSILPEFQGKGIGGMLIEQSHQKARELGYKSIIILGHENYYPRFGYVRADTFGIELPFDAPKDNCMAIELVKNGLNNVTGVVEYPKEFYE